MPSRSASCTPAIAMLPSPTAAAQRLTEPERTSPAAKTPGRLVSKAAGGRAPSPRSELGNERSRFDETFLVALNFRRQPFRAGRRADHRKNRRRLDRAAFTGLRVFQFDRLEHGVPIIRRIVVQESSSIFSRARTRRDK